MLDTSTFVDGCVVKRANTRLLSDAIATPKFVLIDSHELSSSSIVYMKNRGVRGLEPFGEFRYIELIDFCVIDSNLESSDSRDEKILFVVSSSKGLLLATREALPQEARQIGIPFVDILNLNMALAQEVAIGGAPSVSIMKIGKEDGQGFGYLEDGSMVVVNPSGDMLGSRVLAKVKSVISAIGDGWLFFKLLRETTS